MSALRLRRPAPLTVVRAFFFLWFAGGSFLQPFLPIFYRSHGLSGFQIGIFSSVGFAIGMVAAPLWSRWMDRVPAPQRLLQLAVLLYIGAMLLLSQQSEFWPIVGVVALGALVSSGLEPVANVLAVRATRGTRSGFGSVRVFGSLGWAVLVVVAGWWIQQTSIQSSFQGFALCMLAGCAALFWYQHRPAMARPAAAPSSPNAHGMGFLRSRSMVALLAAVLLVWAALAGVRQFETLYFKQLGAGEQIIGLSATLSAAVELPFMFWADSLARKKGAHWLLITGFFLDGCIRGIVLLWPSVPLLMAARMLVGVSFSMTTVGVVAYVQEYAPESQHTSAIGFFTVVVRNLVFFMAYPLAGILFDALGAYWLYAIAFGGNVLAAGILFFSGKPKPLGVETSFPETAVAK